MPHVCLASISRIVPRRIYIYCKRQMTYYAVAKGRVPGVYTEWYVQSKSRVKVTYLQMKVSCSSSGRQIPKLFAQVIQEDRIGESFR